MAEMILIIRYPKKWFLKIKPYDMPMFKNQSRTEKTNSEVCLIVLLWHFSFFGLLFLCVHLFEFQNQFSEWICILNTIRSFLEYWSLFWPDRMQNQYLRDFWCLFLCASWFFWHFVCTWLYCGLICSLGVFINQRCIVPCWPDLHVCVVWLVMTLACYFYSLQ